MPQHPIVHVEIPAADLVQAGDFYSQVFGWQVEHIPQMGYTVFQAEGGPGGGFTKVDEQTAPVGRVLVYIHTDDIDGSLARIEANGGVAVAPKTEIPGIGWFAVFTDPTGNRLALFTENREAMR